MNNKNGFSLLSFLVYLFCFTLVTFFMNQLIISFILPTITTTRQCRSLIALHVATDLFVRDIKNGSHVIHCSPQELVLHNDARSIGWHISENKLERIEGVYDNGWKNKKISIVAVGIQSGKFVPEIYKNDIIGVEMTLVPQVNDKKIVVAYVAKPYPRDA